MARRLKEAGATSVMPAGSPIGSGQGVLNPNNIRIILEDLKADDPSYPVIVDAGVGTASDVAIAMELGCDGVLLNTGIAGAATRCAWPTPCGWPSKPAGWPPGAGRIPRKLYATASSPTQGVIGRKAETSARQRMVQPLQPDLRARRRMAQLDPPRSSDPAARSRGGCPATSTATSSSRWPGRWPGAIERPGHLVVEAGTGVGKSFAYLVPAIQAAADTKKKVVVSTHTIALQEQLLSKDIPFLRSVMPQEFSAVLVKGRSNYISLRRLDVGDQQRPGIVHRGPRSSTSSPTIRMWAKPDHRRQPLRPRFPAVPSVWEAVQSEDGNCLGRECPRHKECFFYQGPAADAARPTCWSSTTRCSSRDLALRRDGVRPLARLPRGDHRRGAHARSRRRRAPRAAALQPGRRLHAGPAVQRADRQGACWPSTGSTTRSDQVQRRRAVPRTISSTAVAAWQRRPGTASTAGVRQPLGCPDTLCEELRKLADGDRRGARDQIEEPEEQHRADRPRRSGASAWPPARRVACDRLTEDSVYWVEVEQKSRLRVRLAVGAAGRRPQPARACSSTRCRPAF